MKLTSRYTTLLLAFMLLIVIFVPLATIWSLNTLFPVLAIPYTFKTWLAAAILGSVVAAKTAR